MLFLREFFFFLDSDYSTMTILSFTWNFSVRLIPHLVVVGSLVLGFTGGVRILQHAFFASI